MSQRKAAPSTDARAADLNAYSATLATMLPALLLGRDWAALTRWGQVRSWVDNALDGELSPDLTIIDLAVAYLAERATRSDGP